MEERWTEPIQGIEKHVYVQEYISEETILKPRARIEANKNSHRVRGIYIEIDPGSEGGSSIGINKSGRILISASQEELPEDIAFFKRLIEKEGLAPKLREYLYNLIERIEGLDYELVSACSNENIDYENREEGIREFLDRRSRRLGYGLGFFGL